MFINKISITNFKCFEGTIVINDLAKDLSDKKNIILIGGLNGAGKTTIFEAILLCLYGQKNKNLWPSKGAKREDYQNYISSVLNREAKKNSLRPRMSIEIELKDIEISGVKQSIAVNRTWIFNNNSQFDENLEISLLINNVKEPFEFYTKENWDDFIEELIPYDISQFFFFDGEKIQDFVKDEDREFAESLEKVLGISLFRKLQEDLDITRRKIAKEYEENSELKEKILEIESEIEKLERIITLNQEKIDEIDQQINQIDLDIERIDSETKRISNINYSSIEEYEKTKEEYLQKKASLEEKIFRDLKEKLPFVLNIDLCLEILEQLKKEDKFKDNIIINEKNKNKIEIIADKFIKEIERFNQIQEDLKIKYKNILINILKNELLETQQENILILHDLSKSESMVIEQQINEIYNDDFVENFQKNINDFYFLENQLKKIKSNRINTNDDEIKKLLEEKGALKKEKDILIEQKNSLSTENLKLKKEVETKRRKLSEYENKVENTSKMKDQIEYCKRLKHTIEDYIIELRITKISQLQNYTLEMWNKLAIKKDQIKKIIINPNTDFTIELYDKNNNLIDKTKLSAGEKEILAISLIYSLTRIADRELPIVIDTPLGRLDTYHRENISRFYFPNASHQVILLSTNTEIVNKELEVIKECISKKFYIERISTRSQIKEGYFE
ncbi:MAG: DNA sulfur modification protein DndD [Ignavibacteria bacterium]|nr:DNA sulfur modification protein DndD [Ignavibacteria bacterium]